METRTPDTVKLWLHLEGAAALIAGGLIYDRAGGSWLLALPLLLLPDLSMVGYVVGPRVGSFVYNFAHNWVIGLAALGVGYWLGSDTWLQIGAVLVAHVGADRLLGYGLKHVSGFKDTHMQRA